MNDPQERVREIAEFLNIPEAAALAKLSQGFGALHAEVNADFRRANPQTDEELLNWYRSTDKYVFELSSYHLDAGFNYSGMCEGITKRLKSEGLETVLCLGDGIADLSIAVYMTGGLLPIYHDLSDSKTAGYGAFRFQRKTGTELPCALTDGWAPDFAQHLPDGNIDAIVSLDFLEHVVDVEGYVKAIFSALKPNGLFFAQNAFACGSGPDGSIPMHLARNDRFEKDWDPLLFSLGFRQESSNWYRKPA